MKRKTINEALIPIAMAVLTGCMNFIYSVNIVYAASAFSEKLKEKITGRTNVFAGRAGFQDVKLPTLAAIIIQALISILAIMFLGLILYGGYVWMMARGNEEEVSRGRGIIRHSIIGLIIVLSFYAIGYFVLYWLSTGGNGGGEGRPIVG